MTPTEARLQQEMFQWHWNTFPDERGALFMVNNNPKNKVDGRRLRGLGLVAGVSDLVYIANGGQFVGIEIKTPTGKQSDKQKWFEQIVVTRGAQYHVARSVNEFKFLIKYLQNGK